MKEASKIVAENFSRLGVALLVFLVLGVSIRAESAPCQPVTYEHSEYTVCEVDLRRQSIKLFWKKSDGHPYEYLSNFPVGTSALAARAKVTAESLIDEAEQARAGAMESKQFGAVNGAIKNKGILSGVWVERAEVGQPGEFSHLSDAELEAAVRERLVALGWLPVPLTSNGSITHDGGSDDE